MYKHRRAGGACELFEFNGLSRLLPSIHTVQMVLLVSHSIFYYSYNFSVKQR